MTSVSRIKLDKKRRSRDDDDGKEEHEDRDVTRVAKRINVALEKPSIVVNFWPAEDCKFFYNRMAMPLGDSFVEGTLETRAASVSSIDAATSKILRVCLVEYAIGADNVALLFGGRFAEVVEFGTTFPGCKQTYDAEMNTLVKDCIASSCLGRSEAWFPGEIEQANHLRRIVFSALVGYGEEASEKFKTVFAALRFNRDFLRAKEILPSQKLTLKTLCNIMSGNFAHFKKTNDKTQRFTFHACATLIFRHFIGIQRAKRVLARIMREFRRPEPFPIQWSESLEAKTRHLFTPWDDSDAEEEEEQLREILKNAAAAPAGK